MTTNTTSETVDDLTQIRGIGRVRQQWLRESLSIHTFSDLARAPVDKLEQQLKRSGRIAVRKDINAWITEAGRLAAATRQPEQEDTEAIPPNTVQVARSTTSEDDWKPIASFIVEFHELIIQGRQNEQQVKVHNVETNTWAIIAADEIDRLDQWLLTQLSQG